MELLRIKYGRRATLSVSAPDLSSSVGFHCDAFPSANFWTSRRNRFVLQVTRHRDNGMPFDYCVPFGQKRIVPIVLPIFAVQNKTQMIRFRTATEMLESSGCTVEYPGTVPKRGSGSIAGLVPESRLTSSENRLSAVFTLLVHGQGPTAVSAGCKRYRRRVCPVTPALKSLGDSKGNRRGPVGRHLPCGI
jgi:hypothetical protein